MVTDLRAVQPSIDVGADHGATSPSTRLLTLPPDARSTSRLTDWRGFHSELQRAAIAATQTGAPLSLLMLERVESDRLNQPEAATAAMLTLADTVRAAVGEHGLLACYSEVLLAIILTDTDLCEAVRRAEHISHQVSPPPFGAAATADLAATAAIGIAQFQDDEPLGYLIQRTVEALKQARTQSGLTVFADDAARRPSRRAGDVQLA